MRKRYGVALVPLLACFGGACRGKPATLPFDGYDQDSSYKPLGDEGSPASGQCTKVTAEDLRGRKAVTTAGGVPGTGGNTTTLTISRAGLWSEFEVRCGQPTCHGSRDGTVDPLFAGRYTISEETFHTRPNIGSGGQESILSSDEDKVMPPGSGDGTKRRANDPIRLLGERLAAWEKAGFPDSFQVQVNQPAPVLTDPGISEDPYRLSSDLAVSLTNIGSCLPVAKLHRSTDETQALDRMFAAAQSIDDLPETLVETDLVSLDSELLARRAVYSYAPTYTLFSDNAAKMRYVRVPMGKKVRYNPVTKDFDIPPNTRFYKTFLRKVVDKDGEVGHRKMETRLIVSRPDEQLADGSWEVRALMVVYAWDKDERMAHKVTDPLRNLQPWADRLCPYVEDEREPRTQKENPIIPATQRTSCTYMTEEEVANPASGKVRHYAIPSQERCVQCHMGSSNRSFILGFTPWHVDRRAEGEGGIIEAPHPDELDQLERLIEYGVIEGLEPGQAKLEESQFSRKPRNDFELRAQGYMMGNCAFCHNPGGFPTIENPVLKEFDLFPTATGGVFQFPLEKFSPRAKVGPKQDLRFPYITPALGDFAPADGYETGSGDAKVLDVGILEKAPTNDWLVPFNERTNHSLQDVEEFDVISGRFTFVGPWRSLIWRNVYTPFTYEEDNTIFIHMPRNVPGFDCKAQKIMAEWMLSIPSIPKLTSPEVVDMMTGEIISPRISAYRKDMPGFEQPFLEVRPGDLPYAKAREGEDPFPKGGRFYNYDRAAFDANQRILRYRNGLTGQHCPDDEDIVDALVVNSKEFAAPFDRGTMNGPRVNQAAQGLIPDRVPDHAHWVPLDTTDAPGRWAPRRPDWKGVLVDRDPKFTVSPKVKKVIDELLALHLTPEREAFSTQPVPMGLWHPQCRDSEEAKASKNVAQARVEERTAGPRGMYRWLFERRENGSLRWSQPSELAERVHSQSRGEAVFRAICMNCHGKDIDSRSPLASTILELTGAQTRVANFVEGIYGPLGAPGQYAEGEFSQAGRGGTPADWQARYMVFMGMGGTESVIPSIALKLVSTSAFYGAAPAAGEGISDANMLESARTLCRDVLRTNWNVFDTNDNNAELALVLRTLGPQPFVRGTGHFELWASICGFQNTPTVQVFTNVVNDVKVPGVPFRAFEFSAQIKQVFRAKDALGQWVYPPNHPVGTMAGKVERGIKPTNALPWCLKPPDEEKREIARAYFRRHGMTRDEDMPFCPRELFAQTFGRNIHEILPKPFDQELQDAWTRTGAINAGVAAYYYMDGVTKGKLKPQVAFDECKK
jgi:mono/diheme cytochrome c family protein